MITNNLPSLSRDDIEKNTNEFLELMNETGDPGVDSILDYLQNKTDFFEAPASSMYHLNVVGGLCRHSLNVYEQMVKLVDDRGFKVDKKSLIKVGLLHDVCKANFYNSSEKWHKPDGKTWASYQAWGIDEGLPLGHGEKSLAIVNRFLALTIGEMLAIRWHMGPWTPGVIGDYATQKQFGNAKDKTKLIDLVHIADQIATGLIEEVVAIPPVK